MIFLHIWITFVTAIYRWTLFVVVVFFFFETVSRLFFFHQCVYTHNNTQCKCCIAFVVLCYARWLLVRRQKQKTLTFNGHNVCLKKMQHVRRAYIHTHKDKLCVTKTFVVCLFAFLLLLLLILCLSFNWISRSFSFIWFNPSVCVCVCEYIYANMYYLR